jgi:hypothetical protein
MPNFDGRGPEVVRTNVGTGDEKETTHFPNGVSVQWSPVEWRPDFDPEGPKSAVGYVKQGEFAHRFEISTVKQDDGSWNATIMQRQPHTRSLGLTSPHMYHDSGVLQISDEPIKYGNKMSLSRSKVDQFVKLSDGRTIANPAYKDIKKDWQNAVIDSIPIIKGFEHRGYESAAEARDGAQQYLHSFSANLKNSQTYNPHDWVKPKPNPETGRNRIMRHYDED